MWFRYRKGLVPDAERLSHMADRPLGARYLASPCGQHFDRDEIEQAPYPVDDPPAHAPEPCAICVMRLLLSPSPQTGTPRW